MVYAAFLLYPLLRAVQISFYEWDGLTLASWVGFDNYAAVLQDEGLRGAFGHALVLILFFAVLPVVVGLLLASILNRARVRGLPSSAPSSSSPRSSPWWWWRWRGGRSTRPTAASTPSWMPWVWARCPARGSATTAPPSRRSGSSARGSRPAWCTVLLLAGMGRIGTELYEAARLDGAGPVREFFAVTLPSVRGEIAVALTLTVIAALRTFDLVYVTTRGGPGNTTSVPSYEVYNRAFKLGEVGSAAAIGVCLTLVIFSIAFLINRIGDGGTHEVSSAERTANYVILVAFATFALSPILTVLTSALGAPDAGDTGGLTIAGLHLGNFAEAWQIGQFGTYLRTRCSSR